MSQATVSVEAKPFHLSRTLIMAALTVIAGVLQLLAKHLQLSGDTNAILLAVAGIIFAILRIITNQPLTSSTDPQIGEAPAPPLLAKK